MRIWHAVIVSTIIGTLSLSSALPAQNLNDTILPYDLSESQMEVEAFNEYKTKSKLNEKKWGERSQKSYNALVKFGVQRLKKKGYLHAPSLQKEWDQKYSKVFLSLEIGVNDIPDHEPAIKWLNEFYLTLVSVLGESTVKSLHLDDIDTLNRGLPVVFKPKEVEKLDYNQCFVKSSKAIGYWSCTVACSTYNWLGTGPTITICTPLASACRMAFGLIADPISDGIWESVHK